MKFTIRGNVAYLNTSADKPEGTSISLKELVGDEDTTNFKEAPGRSDIINIKSEMLGDIKANTSVEVKGRISRSLSKYWQKIKASDADNPQAVLHDCGEHSFGAESIEVINHRELANKILESRKKTRNVQK